MITEITDIIHPSLVNRESFPWYIAFIIDERYVYQDIQLSL